MYRMLSFDGGGLRGLVTIGLMHRIGSVLQDPLWYRKADLYAGTSTGGIIAMGLAGGVHPRCVGPCAAAIGIMYCAVNLAESSGRLGVRN